MLKRVHFRSPVLPFLLVAPQIAITLIFFIWPAAQALYFSVQRQDAFGLSVDFVGLENFVDLLDDRSEEHTSELQSLMRISYAVFCLKKKKHNKTRLTAFR